MHGKITLSAMTLSFRDISLLEPSDPQSIQTPIKCFQEMANTHLFLIQHHLWMSKFSTISCVTVPGTFKVSHQKYIWQGASRSKRAKAKAENSFNNQCERLSSSDSSLITVPGTVEARPREAAET